MRLPRMTTRHLMVMVAVMSVCFWTSMTCQRWITYRNQAQIFAHTECRAKFEFRTFSEHELPAIAACSRQQDLWGPPVER